jgi:formylmethanofuran dehydrogenase subunit E
MEEDSDQPTEPPAKTVQCGMCKRRVPLEQTREMSGRILCFGCLASWYDEEEE